MGGGEEEEMEEVSSRKRKSINLITAASGIGEGEV